MLKRLIQQSSLRQATPATQAWQAIEDAEILPVVLEHLLYQIGLINCAAVSKTWKKASNAVQLKALCMKHSPAMSPAALTSTLQWLQQKHRQLQLGKLQQLHMQFDLAFAGNALDHSRETAVMSLLAAIGFLSLHSCTLIGNFSILAAVQLLPATLQESKLAPSMLPAELPLSSFDRFPSLAFLAIATAKDALDKTSAGNLPSILYALHQPCKGLQQLVKLLLLSGLFQCPKLSWLLRLEAMGVRMTVDQAAYVNINQMTCVAFQLDNVPADRASLYPPNVQFSIHVTKCTKLQMSDVSSDSAIHCQSLAGAEQHSALC